LYSASYLPSGIKIFVLDLRIYEIGELQVSTLAQSIHKPQSVVLQAWVAVHKRCRNYFRRASTQEVIAMVLILPATNQEFKDTKYIPRILRRSCNKLLVESNSFTNRVGYCKLVKYVPFLQ
jgi:hypothetical protein